LAKRLDSEISAARTELAEAADCVAP